MAGPQPHVPGTPGKRLLATIVDEIATESPEKVYGLIPRSKQHVTDGFFEITYRQVARAVDKMAWWLDREVGSSKDFDVVAYVGAADIRYPLIVLAGMKTGHPIMLPYPGNSEGAMLNLVDETKCKALIASKGSMAVWDKILEKREAMKTHVMPELDDWLQGDKVEPFPYAKDFREGRNDSVHINQTSGTTGLPRPISWTNAMISASVDTSGDTSKPSKSAHNICWELLFSRKTLVTLPPSWSFGILLWLHYPVFYDMKPVFLPPSVPQPITAEIADQAHQLANVEGGVYVPDLLKQLSKHKAYLDNMKRKLKFIIFGGAPLDPIVGNLLSTFLTVQPVYGTTEIGCLNNGISDSTDWMYYQFHPRDGAVFEPFEGNLHELVLHRSQDSTGFKQMIFERFADIDKYHTKDLFVEHGTRKGLWAYRGRTDDFVSLSNLSKFNATYIESVIDRHPSIRSALMDGNGRERPFLIVEPSQSPLHSSATFGEEFKYGSMFIDGVWPLIEEANQNLDSKQHIVKGLVIVADASKPIKKLGKSSIDRRGTLEEYKHEIEQLYREWRASTDLRAEKPSETPA